MGGLTVLHINTERGYRGGEIQTLHLAAGLEARGHRCLMAVQVGSPLATRAADRGLEVRAHAMRGEFDLGAVRWLSELIRKARPDVLHYHTSHAVTLGTLAHLRRQGPLRVATRRGWFGARRNLLFRVKFGWRVDHVIAVSGSVRDSMLAAGLRPDMVSVVHSGIDLGRFAGPLDGAGFRKELGLGPDDLLVGSVGALAPEKGYEALLRALARLKDDFPGVHLAVVGEGPLRDALKATTSRLDLESRVFWAGFREDVPSVTASFDAAVLPSLTGEGSPAVVKEAMAAGVPVVATRVGGVGEIVEDGVQGLLVPVGDEDALARALGRLLADPDLRRALGEAGRVRAREFSMERMVERTEAVYLALRERAA